MIALAYTSATMQSEEIKRMGVQYVGRVKEYGRAEGGIAVLCRLIWSYLVNYMESWGISHGLRN